MLVRARCSPRGEPAAHSYGCAFCLPGQVHAIKRGRAPPSLVFLHDTQAVEGVEAEAAAGAAGGTGEQQQRQQRGGGAAGPGAVRGAGGGVLELKPWDFVRAASHDACGAYHWTQWVHVRLWGEEGEQGLGADREAPGDQVRGAETGRPGRCRCKLFIQRWRLVAEDWTG